MNLDDRSVDGRVLEIGIVRERRENPLEFALEGPSAETLPHRAPLAERLGQIAPWRSGAHDPQHRFNEQAVVRRRPTGITLLAGQQGRNPLPLCVCQKQSNQGGISVSSLESDPQLCGNPPERT